MDEQSFGVLGSSGIDCTDLLINERLSKTQANENIFLEQEQNVQDYKPSHQPNKGSISNESVMSLEVLQEDRVLQLSQADHLQGTPSFIVKSNTGQQKVDDSFEHIAPSSTLELDKKISELR